MSLIKKIKVILLFFIIFLNFSNFGYSQDLSLSREESKSFPIYDTSGNLIIYYFGTDSCFSCYETYQYLEKTVNELKAKDAKIVLKKFDTVDFENEKTFWEISVLHEVPFDSIKTIPAIFVGNDYLINKEDIIEKSKDLIKLKLYEEIEEKIEVQSNDKISILKDFNFNKLTVFIAGIFDGINPCAISIMLFFITYIIANNSKSNILYIGLSFCIGTFIAYLGIGIGLFKFIYAIGAVKYLGLAFYIGLTLLSLFLAILNISDYIAIKKGNYSEIKNQLSSPAKKRIHNLLKKASGSKTIYLTAFISAFIVSILEFFCTGQIYLPMITYMINLELNQANNYLLLVLYNLGFILPLAVITLLIYYGKKVIDISQLLVDKLSLIKLTGALFFIGVFILTLTQLTKMI